MVPALSSSLSIFVERETEKADIEGQDKALVINAGNSHIAQDG